LECHCTVSSFLVKLLSGEWRGIHHGYCQNVLKHYRIMSLCLSNMSAAAYSSRKNPPPKTQNHSHVISCDTPLLCFKISCPPVTLTLTLLTWGKWWAPNNATKGQMGFNSAFKGLITGHTHLLSPLLI